MASSISSHPPILDYLCADPGLPSKAPTEAHWQHIPHPTLSNAQSVTLPKSTDIAIIGSGITAASTAKTLLERDPSISITIFEARGLTSGATGRNGGHLISAAAEEYPALAEQFGPEMAKKIATFTFANVARVHEIAEEYGGETKNASEIRNVTSVSTYLDEESFQAAQESLAVFEEKLPDWKGKYRIVSGEAAMKDLGIVNAVGALILPGGALWPYRLITRVFGHLTEKHGPRLRIETYTPVESVTYDSDVSDRPYGVVTSRGKVSAKTIIHCTNGYTGHLLPELRGRLFPLRGTMTVQTCGSTFPNMGSTRSWSFFRKPTFDPTTGIAALGLYYLTQNAKTGDLFLGGEQEKIEGILTSDDSKIGTLPLQNLSGLLPKLFGDQGWAQPRSSSVKSAWSGIMGFTADGVPLVGKIPTSVSKRNGDGEWIAAGFNGYGMANCWLTGEALGQMILGRDVSEWFPEAYLLTDERIEKSLIRETAFERHFGISLTGEM